MLYELVAVVRPGSLSETKAIATTIGQTVLRGGGVIRGYTNWGVFKLPKPVTKHQSRQTDGHHFIVRFDSSAAVQKQIQTTLGLDPRMIRFGVVKLGERLDQIKDISGQVEWSSTTRVPMVKKYFPDLEDSSRPERRPSAFNS